MYIVYTLYDANSNHLKLTFTSAYENNGVFIQTIQRSVTAKNNGTVTVSRIV
jgi:hypothetical protein